ncbi:riboflavin-specific deaminase [Rhizophagus irregularis DAOM 181602=DAOM 197198]|nr:riboflavin-specific deaminase [Rhizophagus irregularis DAOM 181602=DAOM 197198]
MTPFASNIINIPVSEAPTPNQKRNLLFNVEQPLELSIEEFDKEWWPLVSNIWTNFSHKNNVNGNLWEVFICRFNKPKKSSTRKEEISQEKRRVTKIRSANLCFAKIKVYRYASEQKVLIERFKDSPDHSHTLEESEKLKRSQTVQNLVMQEAIKNYRPPEIVNAVKEYATEKLDLGESVKELRRKEVTNIKYKVQYLVEYYEISHLSTYGFVFMHPKQLKNLEQHGWLTLIDSTHKTNRYDCRLFTLYIRDYYGCWNVVFVSKEDSVTIAEGLKIVRRFARHWSPRYFLSDQSNIESNSIRMAFPGLKNGEQDCDVIFCTVHIMRTWMNKIYDKKMRQKMIHAMHKRTKIGCEDLVQQAINECSITTIKNYITRNYTKNIHQWALWARQHFPLLLQVTSTNALESYHSELKSLTSPQHGLIGACHKIVELDKKKCSDSEHVAYEFRVKRISAVGVDDDILQEIHKFPFPV